MLLALPQDPAAVLFLDRQVTLPEGTYAYQVYAPRSRARKPAILFLHGSGERGTDNRAQTQNGIRLLIAKERGRFPAVVVAPQCRPDKRWTDPDMARMALGALDAANREFNGDPERQILTGLSMGGYGTWGLAATEPRRWACLAPVCGGLFRRGQPLETTRGQDPYSATAERTKAIPMWIFHGDLDASVPVSESRQMAAALWARKAPVKYTEYPGVGHNSWDAAYSEPGLLKWMLAQRRRR